MVLSAPWYDSLDIIALELVKRKGLTQWYIVPLGTTLLWLFTYGQ